MRPFSPPEIDNELPEEMGAPASSWISTWEGSWYTRPSILIAMLLSILCMIKLPLELEIERQQRQAGFHSLKAISNELRVQLGRNMMISLLSGLRGVTADYYWRDVTEAWTNEDWDKMRASAKITTLLQPNSEIFWAMSGWQMAYNAGLSVRNDEKKYPNKATRLVKEREWVDEGLDTMKKGVEANPDSYALLNQIGQLLHQKYGDPMGASAYYEKASLVPDSPVMYARIAGFELSNAGKNAEALAYWRRLWARFEKHDDPDYQWPRIYREIRRLEGLLNVPQDQRLIINEVMPAATPR